MNRTVIVLIAFAFWIGAANHVSAAALGADIAQQPPAPEIPTDQKIEELKSQALAGNRESAHQVGRYYLYNRFPCNADVTSGFRRVDEHGFNVALANNENLDNLTFACDATQAIRWLKVAVGAENPEAMKDLGRAYDELREDAKALPWYLRAATAGQSEAQFHLALMLFSGRGGLKSNKALSLFWMRVAESKGPVALDILFHLRFWAMLSPMDRRRAEELFQRYQERGIIPSQEIPKVDSGDEQRQ